MPVSVTQASTHSAVTQFATSWRANNPGLHLHSLTFEKFRSHGLRRTVKESSRQRFVTSDRLLQILRGTRGPGSLQVETTNNATVIARGKLSAIGLTEYIDVSIAGFLFISLYLYPTLTRYSLSTVIFEPRCSGGDPATRRYRVQA